MSRFRYLIYLALLQVLQLTLAFAQSPAPGQNPPVKKAPDKKQEQPADKKTDDKSASDKDKKDAPKDSPAASVVTGPWHVSVDVVAGDQLSLDALALYPRTDDSSSPKTIPGTACATQDLPCKRLHLVITDGVVKDQLKPLHKGDHIQVVYTSDTKQNTLKALSIDSVPTDGRAAVLFGSVLICLLLYCLFSGFKPLQLIISEDNRYSNSRFQIALWFFVLITTYIAFLWLRVWSAGGEFIGGVDIPKNLLLLSGMSVLTFGGAKAITTAKINEANKGSGPGSGSSSANQTQSSSSADSVGAGNASPKPASAATVPPADPTDVNAVVPPVANVPPSQVQAPNSVAPPGGSANQPVSPSSTATAAGTVKNPKNPRKKGDENFFVDLVTDDYGQFDFGDFQMLIVTLIAVGTYIVLIYNFMGTVEYSKITSLPDVDTTLLAAFGLGQGAYLTKKAAGDVGKS